MAETQREKVQNFFRRMGQAIESAPGMQRKGGFFPLERTDAIFRAYQEAEAQETPPTTIEIRPKNFDVRTVPVQPLIGPNDKVASSIDPNTGINFPPGQELDADNIVLSQLGSNATDPAKAAADAVKRDTLLGYKHGGDLAQSQKQEGLINEASDAISGLLGNVDFQGLFRVLARPEFVAPMGPGQSPLTNFVNAAAADRASQVASRAAQQEAGLEGFKAKTDRLKALIPDFSKMPKLNTQVVDLTTGIQANKTLVELGDKIKTLLTANIASTGAGGEVAKAVEAIGAAVGYSPEKGAGSSAQEIDDYVARMRMHVIGTGVFGREANKQELALLDSILPKSGFFKNRERIRRNIDAVMKSAENLMAIKNNLLIQSGYKSFEEMAKQSVPFRRGIYNNV